MHRQGRLRKTWAWSLLGVSLAGLFGCPPAATFDDGQGPLTAADISYDQLRDQHNRRTGHIDQLWTKAAVRFTWHDAEGNRRSERGDDSTLIVRKPHDLAFAVGHSLTETLWWLGSDRHRFWALELKPPNGQPRRATVGQHGSLGPNGAAALPVPVEPHQLIALIGIADLPPTNLAKDQRVYRRDGQWVTDLTLGGPNDPFMRITIDKQFRPVGIQVLTQDLPARLLMRAQLGRYQKLDKHQVVKKDWPLIPTQILIEVPKRRSQIQLSLNNHSDGRPGRIKDAQFDFEGLLKAYRIHADHIETLNPPRLDPGTEPAK